MVLVDVDFIINIFELLLKNTCDYIFKVAVEKWEYIFCFSTACFEKFLTVKYNKNSQIFNMSKIIECGSVYDDSVSRKNVTN